jgi:HSP20 family protein
MPTKQELQVQQKRELENKEESTIPARVFVPTADIYESNDALNVVLEMPGVDKSSVDVRVEDGILKIEGRLDFSKYQGLQPLYTEYNVGSLFAQLPAFQQDRPKQDRSRVERRGTLVGAA